MNFQVFLMLLILVSYHFGWKGTWYNFNVLTFSGLIFGLNIWSVLSNIPCTFEKNGYSAAIRLNVLYMSIWKSILPTLHNVPFLIYVLFSSPRIPHPQSLALVKVCLCTYSCSNWCLWGRDMSGRNLYSTIYLTIYVLLDFVH